MGASKLLAYLAGAGAVTGGSFALADSVGVVVRLAVAAFGIVVLVRAILNRKPHRPAGWWLIAVGSIMMYVDALAITASSGLGPDRRLGSVPQLALGIAAILALATGLGVLGWRCPGSRRWDALDTAITATGAFLLAWVFYIDPTLARSASSFATVAAVAVPAGSLLMFAMAVKLAFAGALSTWSGRMLLLAIAASLCVSGLVIEPIGAPNVPISLSILAGWVAFMILVGAAGIAPGFTSVIGDARRTAATELPYARVALFVLVALIAPLNVAIGFSRAGTAGPTLAAIVVPPLCGTLILLILVIRLTLVARLANRRAQELGDKSASLTEAVAKHGELERELAYRAMHDALTGLGNREVLTARMDRLADARDETRDVTAHGQALMMLDLDGFKHINDTQGHPAGDELLVDVARRLVGTLGQKAVAVRLGGDEFAVLLDDTPPDEARRAAERIRHAVRVPYHVAGTEVFLSASIGLLITEPGARRPSVSDALRDADQALYSAKRAGRDRVVEFHPKPEADARHAHLSRELRYAIDRNELILHYQPIVELDEDRVIAVEALVRWQPAGDDVLSPAQFLPIADQTGLIVEIGGWILRRALRDARRWHAEHDTMVAVNVSRRQLDDPTFSGAVLRALADTGLPGGALILEITQSSFTEIATEQPVLAQLEQLRDSGVQIAIDDFVAGRSSPPTIARLPVDLVKFDCPPTQGLGGPVGAPMDLTFVLATLDLISGLRLSAVAVGIETADQADTLRRLNCRYGQGYYHSPPLPPDRIAGLLHRQHTRRESATDER